MLVTTGKALNEEAGGFEASTSSFKSTGTMLIAEAGAVY